MQPILSYPLSLKLYRHYCFENLFYVQYSIPKIALVGPPRNYVTSLGVVVKAEDVDVIARMVSMGKFHRTFAGSGLYNLAAVLLLEGTIPVKKLPPSFLGSSLYLDQSLNLTCFQFR